MAGSVNDNIHKSTDRMLTVKPLFAGISLDSLSFLTTIKRHVSPVNLTECLLSVQL